jgi:isopentenyl phosphate kinase
MTQPTTDSSNTPNSYVIGKLGGSVITDKARLKTADEEAILSFARAFGDFAPALRRRVILIAGGGSFGHALAHAEFAPDATDRPAAAAPVFHEWAVLFEQIWRRAGPPCKTVTADELLRDTGAGIRLDPAPLHAILAAGVTPVLMPSVIFQRERTTIFTSDLFPLFVARAVGLTRFAALSDVEGVRIGGRTVATIAPEDRAAALGAATPSEKPDITGGMRRKLKIMLRLAAQGVEGVICRGRPELLEDALFASPPPGTWMLPGRTVRRPPASAVA